MMWSLVYTQMVDAMCSAILLALPACGGETAAETAPAETAVTFTDDLGREISVDAPERVACLTASFADIWCTAGGGDTIVAATNATWTYFDLPMGADVVNLGASKELNVEQLTSSVRWTQTMQNMIAAGANEFIEVGPGKVLQGLIRKTSRDVKAAGVASLADVNA